jgi:hypothetical protein
MQRVSGNGNERLIHFGAALGAALGLLAVLKPVHGPVLLGCATIILSVAIAFPRMLHLPYRGMNLAAQTAGKALTLVLLTVFFCLVISPLAVVRRISTGVVRRGDPARPGTSRWKLRSGEPVRPYDLEKQF